MLISPKANPLAEPASQNRRTAAISLAKLLRTAALQGLWVSFLTSSVALSESQSPNPLPQEKASEPSCELLSRGQVSELANQEVTLQTFLNDFLDTLKAGKYSDLNRFFHSQSKARADIGDKIQAILENRYDKPWQWSLFRAWRIQVPDGKKAILSHCPDADGASVISLFGQQKQFALWLQIMGQNELGRLILAVAPEKGSLKLVGLRIQQWTQNGEDWEKWVQKAQTYQTDKNSKQAYLSFDVAQKLLQGEDLVLYPQRQAIWAERDKVFEPKQLLNSVNDGAQVKTIAYVGSLLAKEGTGLLIREIVPNDLSTRTYKDMCEKRAKALISDGWLQKGQGIRCNFIMNGMDPLQDSGLGGFYLTPEDLKNR